MPHGAVTASACCRTLRSPADDVQVPSCSPRLTALLNPAFAPESMAIRTSRFTSEIMSRGLFAITTAKHPRMLWSCSAIGLLPPDSKCCPTQSLSNSKALPSPSIRALMNRSYRCSTPLPATFFTSASILTRFPSHPNLSLRFYPSSSSMASLNMPHARQTARLSTPAAFSQSKTAFFSAATCGTVAARKISPHGSGATACRYCNVFC